MDKILLRVGFQRTIVTISIRQSILIFLCYFLSKASELTHQRMNHE